ncbi:hypothetical protein K9M16_02820 [Candidatus Babeliales bacterium]|nr:hypothetical protein [Candidatus Babeliales bacterium]
MNNFKKIILLSLVFGILSTNTKVQAVNIFKRIGGLFSTKRQVKNVKEQHAEKIVKDKIKSGKEELQGGWWQRRKQKQALIKKEKQSPGVAYLTGQTAATKSEKFQKAAKDLYTKKSKEAKEKHQDLQNLSETQKITVETTKPLEEARRAKEAASEKAASFSRGLKSLQSISTQLPVAATTTPPAPVKVMTMEEFLKPTGEQERKKQNYEEVKKKYGRGTPRKNTSKQTETLGEAARKLREEAENLSRNLED